MCTAISFKGINHYFGRNLDLEYRYDESITIMPRNFIIKYKSGEIERRHFAIIGTTTLIDGYPLYYDATNEYGLSMAGLNFVRNAFYFPEVQFGKVNLAPHELILYVLSKCKTVEETIRLLNNVAIIDVKFRADLPTPELHWLISDKNDSITVEFMRDGMKIYKNIVGVLTNNPPFDFHINNLNNYINISNKEPRNEFSEQIKLLTYSKGMGAIGLPGDLSSSSRFIKGTFTKLNATILETEEESVSQFFHILAAVEQVEGCVKVGESYERTQYSSCCNTDKGIYYYKTYTNFQISAIDMHKENLDSSKLISYQMIFEPKIYYHN